MKAKISHWIAHRIVPSLPYPLDCLGGRVCVHSGEWADIFILSRVLVVRWRKGNRYAFISTDGTPRNAKWIFGQYSDI